MLRKLLKLLIILFKILGLFIGILLFIFTVKYITCPVYDFYPGEKFTGTQFYNPYKNMDAENWRRGNFQIQSAAWAGITSGRGNTNEDIQKVYKSLGYDIIGTSDYQKINRYGIGQPGYIPVYEHGYGILKTHQVLLGARKVLWKDYPLFQTIHNKQHIIHSLRKDNSLIYLAHPMLKHAYSIDNMKILSGYDGIEVLNNSFVSMEHWDAALSEGNYVTLLGNDDAHDISNPDEIGFHCTFINSPTLEEKDIIQAFKSGNTYGARIWRPHGESIEEKIKRTSILPTLIRHELVGDTLFVQCDSVVRFIRFIGQGGVVLKTDVWTDVSYYKFKEDDSYIRAEILFWHESSLHMNPVCRYNGIKPASIPMPTINHWKTWAQRIVGFATLIFLGINIIYLRKRWKRKRA